MSHDWLKQEHLDLLKELLPEIEDRTAKRRFREMLYGLTVQLTQQLTEDATSEFMKEAEAPITESDLQEVNALLAKGVQHNGVFPELSAVQVGRALRVVSELLGRAAVATLDFEDQEGLEWVFDQAAAAHDGLNRANVRQLESRVRAGLGLDVRLLHYTPVNEQHPA